MALKIFGQLDGEMPVVLGIAEKAEEVIQITSEYAEVYEDKITFMSSKVSKKELQRLRNEAFGNLFKSLSIS
jgi:PII-like signaling protein